MNHETAKQRLWEYYDGELETGLAAEVRTHLDGCAECRGLYQGWTRTAKTFFPAPSTAPSEFFVRQVMQKVHALETPKTRVFSFPRLPWLVPAFGIALLFFAVVPAPPQNFSMETLFQEGVSSWMTSTGAVTADDALQFVMEGTS